ncbi:Predicted arabinose efflux permease, MFS family [Mucilaginibacter pineti]|uniref:Predicted arabinose efflux permease, MFS family n=1 Tax=Mucilaginibacter pineti TaxID=1391627 RepID=A0A1G6U688_9SPHI|nr:MFS transporter [Mucilaginibacter pineti]SDD36107.1 Predicted arabinose efflux permease, MFS family [Mucilaginibacter pineti]
MDSISTINQNIVSQESVAPYGMTRNLGVIFGMVFTEFMIMGISLGVLPAFIHQTLGLSNIWVGVVIGTQYVTTLATRQFAGKMADHKGGKRSVLTGIITSAFSGILLFMATSLVHPPFLSLGLVLAGRILLGIGESFLVVGIFAWGFALVGHNNTGKVMVWNGMGMYSGMACGAPAGMLLQTLFGLNWLFSLTIILPCIIYLIMRLLPPVPLPKSTTRLPFYKAVGLVWTSGSALALASIGFGGIASFISLYFLQNHWQNASFALTAFGLCYVIVRIFLSGAPDKFGGARIALISLLIEIAGQLLIWAGISGTFTILGAALTGIGMSLIFPSLGQIAMKKVPPANRGMAIAAYNAFFDLGLGLTAPLAGWIAGQSHYQNVYLFGTLAAATSVILVYREYRNNGTK